MIKLKKDPPRKVKEGLQRRTGYNRPLFRPLHIQLHGLHNQVVDYGNLVNKFTACIIFVKQ